MKIIYVHHGNRAISNPPKQTDDLTELGLKTTLKEFTLPHFLDAKKPQK